MTPSVLRGADVSAYASYSGYGSYSTPPLPPAYGNMGGAPSGMNEMTVKAGGTLRPDDVNGSRSIGMPGMDDKSGPVLPVTGSKSELPEDEADKPEELYHR